MALPNRSAAPYVVLGDSENNNPFVDKRVDIIEDLQAVSSGKPKQLPFFSFKHFLTNYPQENIAVIMAPGCGLAWTKLEFISCDYECTFPTDIVYQYDPDPPLSQPAPDPNGDIGIESGSSGTPGLNQIFPRWHTDDPYDFEALNSGFTPPAGFSYIYHGNLIPLDPPAQLGYCSYEASVTNLDSAVENVSTSSYEYYPFLQTTSEVKVTTKFKIRPHPDNVYSCWSEGTVIKGKVGFKSYDITTEALEDPGTPGYGYTGMEITFGTTSADAGTADWEVTWEDGYTAAEITIPRTAGKVTFINDFWVTEVIPPA